MTAPTSLIGMVDDTQYGTIVADVYEHIPDLLYPASVSVYAQMRRDPRLTAVVDGYALQIRRAQWQLDGTGCRPEVTQFVADCLGLNVVGEDKAGGARRRGISWNDHLRSALLCQVFGHYAFEMEAEIDADGRARLMTLAERIPATITAIHADPKTGDLLGIDQQIMTPRRLGPQITADRLVFYSRNREGASWQGTSLLRQAYAPWLIKKEMMRVAAISNRRWGAGVPVAEALPGTNPSPAQMAEAQRLASAARAGDQAGAAVPAGFTLKIVGLSGSIPDTIGFIRLLNQEIAGAALMPHLDLGTGETGSRALGESFIDSWTLALESEAEAVADTATRQACVPIVDWNWGEDEPVPRVVVSGVGSRREITAESLQLLLTAGALSADPKLEAWVRREYRLPERDPNAPKPLPAGPPARVPDQQADEEPVAASIGGDRVEAHLIGRHNQKTHGHDKAGGGTLRDKVRGLFKGKAATIRLGGREIAVADTREVDPAKFGKNHHPDVTDSEANSLWMYSYGEHHALNQGLRHGVWDDDRDGRKAQQDRVASIRSAIAKNQVRQDVVVTRRTSLAGAGVDDNHPDPSSLVGKVVQDKGFLSTSLLSEVPELNTFVFDEGGHLDYANEPVVMKIHVPKGTKGVYIGASNKTSRYPDEAELLLGDGTRLAVLEAERQGNRWLVHVQVVP